VPAIVPFIPSRGKSKAFRGCDGGRAAENKTYLL